MKFNDYLGREIELSKDSWEHIQDSHPEISQQDIMNVLLNPDEVRGSNYSAQSELYYLIKSHVPKQRYSCVVVKVLAVGCYISSAMTLSNMKKGTVIYIREKE
jgi:hypothetical protein